MLASLIVFALVSTLSPGAATTLATASGAQFGYRRSLPLVLGIAGALALLVAVTATGLAAVLASSPGLSLAMKVAGTSYFLWLAVKIGRAGAPGPGPGGAVRPFGFLGAALLLLANPKAWAMAIGAAASFAGLSADPAILFAALAAVFGGAAFLSLSIWCLGGAALAQRLRNARHWRIVNLILSGLLCLSILQIWR